MDYECESAADYALRNKRYIVEALELIAQGYPATGADDRYIIVENPRYKREPDGRFDPNYVIDVHLLRELVMRLGG